MLRCAALGVAAALCLAPWSPARAAKFDVLELPAVPSHLATKSLLYTVRQFGERYFATGIQGIIIYSDDGGESWTQAEVPVRSSLLDIDFPTPELGWAVGHEGVILHSADGGRSWVKQYDGIRYGVEGLAFYRKLAEEHPGNDIFPALVSEMEFSLEQGADKPFFRVKCVSEAECYALGAYGMVMATFDGGAHWVHRLHAMDNENLYHYFDFSPLPKEGRYFIAGEAGLFLIADISLPFEEQYASRVHSVPWEGSFFASADTADGAIVLGGLRGRMFRTADEGNTWVVMDKPDTSSIMDAVRLADGRLVAVGVAGEVLVSSDNGHSFSRAPVGELGRLASVAEGPGGTLILAGSKGITKIALPR
jgi:photosystem II stability/assembly factor-like uncharacterized protein